LELSNGYVITRERAPNKNRYTLKDPDGNVSVFEGFGNEVPLEIVKAHGIPKVALDMDVRASLNIGEQLEGPFFCRNPVPPGQKPLETYRTSYH